MSSPSSAPTVREVRRCRSEGWQVQQICRYYQVDRLTVERLCLEGGYPYLSPCPHCGEYVPTVGRSRRCERSRCRGAMRSVVYASAA